MNIGLMVAQSDTSLDPAALAERAEEVGFESLFVPEHVFIPVRGSSAPLRRLDAPISFVTGKPSETWRSRGGLGDCAAEADRRSGGAGRNR